MRLRYRSCAGVAALERQRRLSHRETRRSALRASRPAHATGCASATAAAALALSGAAVSGARATGASAAAGAAAAASPSVSPSPSRLAAPSPRGRQRACSGLYCRSRSSSTPDPCPARTRRPTARPSLIAASEAQVACYPQLLQVLVPRPSTPRCCRDHSVAEAVGTQGLPLPTLSQQRQCGRTPRESTSNVVARGTIRSYTGDKLSSGCAPVGTRGAQREGC